MIKFLFCLIFIIPASQALEDLDCLEFHVIKNAPLGFKNNDNEDVGVHWEYLVALEKETGFCIKKNLIPYARIWQSIAQGNHDGGIMFKSASRSNIVEYAALVRTVNVVVIPVHDINVESYNDLYTLTIGKTRGTHLSKLFDEDPNLNIIELNNYGQAAQMIKFGRINAIAGSALVLNYRLKKYHVLNNVNHIKKLTLGKKEQWLQLSKKSKHLDKIPALKKAIDKLKHNGTFDLIMDKYYGEHWKQMNQ